MEKNRFHIFTNLNKKENAILRARAEKISFPIDSKILKIANNMKDYVEFGKDDKKIKNYNLIQSFGIAAPQMGLSKRMFYFSVPKCYDALEKIDDEKSEIMHHLLINPVLVKYKNIFGAFLNGESCLSVPIDVPGIVKRSISITIKGYSLFLNEQVTLNAKGRLAIIILHELDHLNGILYYDKIDNSEENKKQLKFLY